MAKVIETLRKIPHTKFYTIWENAGTRYARKIMELIAAHRKGVLTENGLCEDIATRYQCRMMLGRYV